MEEIKRENRAKPNKNGSVKAYNPFTYEFIYYDADKYVDGNDSSKTGPQYLNTVLPIHRNEDGFFVSGIIPYMRKKQSGNDTPWVDADKPAQIIREYKFGEQVTISEIKDKSYTLSDWGLKLVNETDNAKDPEKKELTMQAL